MKITKTVELQPAPKGETIILVRIHLAILQPQSLRLALAKAVKDQPVRLPARPGFARSLGEAFLDVFDFQVVFFRPVAAPETLRAAVQEVVDRYDVRDQRAERAGTKRVPYYAPAPRHLAYKPKLPSKK